MWVEAMVSACFASAVEIAILSAKPQHCKLMLSVSAALLLAFSCLCVSELVAPLLPKPAALVRRAGEFFFVTGFYVLISIPFPACLRVATWLVYALCLLLVLLCYYLFG